MTKRRPGWTAPLLAGVLFVTVQVVLLLVVVPLAFRSISQENSVGYRVTLAEYSEWGRNVEDLPAGTVFLYHANRFVFDHAWVHMVSFIVVVLGFRYLIRPSHRLLSMFVLTLFLLIQSIWVSLAMLHYWFNLVDVIQ